MKCSEIKVGEVYHEDRYGRAVLVLQVGMPRGALGQRRQTNDGVRVRTVYERSGYYGTAGEKGPDEPERNVAGRDLVPMPDGGLEKWREEDRLRKAADQRGRDLRAALEALGFELRSQDTYGSPALQVTEANLARARALLPAVSGPGRLVP